MARLIDRRLWIAAALVSLVAGACALPGAVDGGRSDGGGLAEGPDGGGIRDDGGSSAAPPDAGGGDAGSSESPDDGGAVDAGAHDAGRHDGGSDDDGGVDDGGAITPASDGGSDGGTAPPPLCPDGCPGDHDVLLQAFYWDVPVDAELHDGLWWDHLHDQLPALVGLGVTGLWVPSPAKGQFGIYDMGYGIYDLYDLGAYDQKGTVETRFGSRAELDALLDAAHDADIEVYADVVLNHVYTGDDELETNPALTSYIASGASVGGVEREVYPSGEVIWSIPSFAGGVVEVVVGGFRLPWLAESSERVYRIDVVSGGEVDDDPPPDIEWHSEADGDAFSLQSGRAYGTIEGPDDEDAFTLLASGDEVRLRLRPRRLGPDGPEPASATHGYRLETATVDAFAVVPAALSRTRVEPVSHVGPGEADYALSFEHFHPSGPGDYLEGPGDDEVRPRWRVFGQDLDTFHPTVADTYQTWGAWLMDTVGFDGVRLDWVVGVQESYVADFLSALPPAGSGGPRFAVAEYFSGRKDRIHQWVQATDPASSLGVRVFDFPLKFTLTDLANVDGAGFDARALSTAGLARDPSWSLPSERVVAFVENHDTGKEHAYWLERDQDLAHAFLLFAPEQPCLFYKHVYGVPLVDQADPSQVVVAEPDLPQNIALLSAVRAHHLEGPLVALSDVGAPFPEADAADVWVARRRGPTGTTGAALVINDHESELRGLWVDTAPPLAGASWAGKQLVDVTGQVAAPATVYEDGRAFLAAPPRSFTLWIPEDEWDPSVVPTFAGVDLAP